jgi:hypothetical protein
VEEFAGDFEDEDDMEGEDERDFEDEDEKEDGFSSEVVVSESEVEVAESEEGASISSRCTTKLWTACD